MGLNITTSFDCFSRLRIVDFCKWSENSGETKANAGNVGVFFTEDVQVDTWVLAELPSSMKVFPTPLHDLSFISLLGKVFHMPLLPE